MLATKVRRVAGRDLLLVAISSFVLAIHSMPSGVEAESADHAIVPDTVKSIPAVIIPVSADAAVARWQAEVAQFYAEQTQAKTSQDGGDLAHLSSVARTSFVTTTPEKASGPTATSASEQGLRHASPPIAPGQDSVARADGVTFQTQSIVVALVITVIVSLVFAAWCVISPTRHISPAMWASRPSVGNVANASESYVINVDTKWFSVSQPMLVRARQCCFAVLVVAAMFVCVT
ncbi:hypothetical protein [Novipirellula maiorica]|nr:hypothetical protein [Rhodopirellula maiorica]